VTSPQSSPLLHVEDLRIEATREGQRRALVAGVTLAIVPGEVLAIVGESGSGKSLTARALVGLLPRGLRASGRVTFDGKDLLTADERELQQIRGNGIALVMQDPFTTLNPLMKCGAQLRPTSGPRRSRQDHRADAGRRLLEVGIRDPNVVDRYPWQLSGGMRQRVALAAALANDPKVLVADEFSTALDVTTQKEIWLLLRRIQEKREMGLVIITHDLRMAFSMCDDVHVMYAGSVMESGTAQAIAEHPQHPYTLGLLLAEPDVKQGSSAELLMRGSVPRADEVTDKCAFSARCPWATEQCAVGKPLLRQREGVNRMSACIRIDEIDDEMLTVRRQEADAAPAPAAERAPSVTGAVLGVSDLRKVFHAERGGAAGERSVVALSGVSIEIGEGECVGLVGESGSGKTTLARCLVGLETPSSGSIEIAGIDATRPARLSKQDRRRLHKVIQYVFQDPYSSLNPTKTVSATLSEAVALDLGRDGRAVSQRVRELLTLVGLPESYEPRKPASLSGGERQRVAIARALAVEPRVVVCDEPVSALDVSVQAQVLELLNSIRQETGVSYLFITHDLAVVRQVADRIYVLYRGEVVEDGPAVELLENPTHPYTRTLLAAVPGEWDRDSGLATSAGPRNDV
jgi:oligopeptide/dipeptide ABC transporter ATP-binding protein